MIKTMSGPNSGIKQILFIHNKSITQFFRKNF